jgi:hypothetical protein
MPPRKQSEVILLLKLSIMKVFILTFFVVLVGCLSGCKTGGSWVKSSSPNVKVVSPSDVIKNPNGTYSLNKANPLPKKDKVTYEDIPQVINEPQKTESKTLSKTVQGESARSKPVAPPNSSAEAQNLPPNEIRSSGGDNTIKPREIVNISMNVVPKNDNSGGKVDKTLDTVIINEDKMKIDWPGLIFFYFIAIMILILSWMVYDLIKDFIYNKKRSQNPFAPHLEEITKEKKPVNNSKKLKREQKRE